MLWYHRGVGMSPLRLWVGWRGNLGDINIRGREQRAVRSLVVFELQERPVHFSGIAGVTLTFLCNLLNYHPIPGPSSVSVDLVLSISNSNDPWNTPAPSGYLLSRRRYLSLARDSENPRFGHTKSPSDYCPKRIKLRMIVQVAYETSCCDGADDDADIPYPVKKPPGADHPKKLTSV